MISISNRQSPLVQAVSASAATAANIRLTLLTAPKILNLRGGRNPAFYVGAHAALGTMLPQGPNTSTHTGTQVVLWLAPDEWLIVAERPEAWSEPPNIVGGTITDVSHSRVVVRVAGPRTRDVLTKGCMLDLDPETFVLGACAQTLICKIPTIIHYRDEREGFDLYVPRSYAHSFWHWLTCSAQEYGYHALAR